MSSKSEAKALPCIFNSLSKEYHDSQLMQCETKEDQRWRHASATAAVLKLTEMANTKYFLALSLFFRELLFMRKALQQYYCQKVFY
jgi:hypothetical protein